MKLGAVLAGAWGGRRRKKKRKEKRRARPAVPRRRREFGFLARASVPDTVAVPAPVVVHKAASAEPVVQIVHVPVPAVETGGRLVTSDLVRPGDLLRKSIEAFLIDQRSPHTQRAYGKDLKRFVKFLHARQLDRGPESIDRMTVIAYKDSLLAEGLEHTSIDRHLATLRSFFRWLVDDGILAKSPAEGVRFLNPKRLSRTHAFTDEEVRKMLAVPNLHTRVGALHYAMLMVLFYTGLRRSELCSLRTSSFGVERDHRVMRLRGKGNSERVIVVVPAVWNAVLHYARMTSKNLGQDQYLFTPIRNNRTGVRDKAIDSSMVFYVVTRCARMAGVANRVSPHSCRATAISNARDHHVPDRAIQEFAGWASPDMIVRYDKRKTSVEKSASKAIHYGDAPRPIPVAPKAQEPGES